MLQSFRSTSHRVRRTANGDVGGTIHMKYCYSMGLDSTYLLLFDKGVYNTRVERIGAEESKSVTLEATFPRPLHDDNLYKVCSKRKHTHLKAFP